MSSLPPSDRASFATTSRLLSCLITESLLKALFVPIRVPVPNVQKRLVGAAIVLSSSASKRDAPYGPADVFVIVPLRHVPIFKAGSQTEIALLDPLDMLPIVYELYEDGVPETQQNGHPYPTITLWDLSVPPELLRDVLRSTCLAYRYIAAKVVHLPNPWCEGSHGLSATILLALLQAECHAGDSTLALTLGPLHLWKKFADGFNIDDDMQEAVAEELRSSVAWQQYSYEHPPPQAPTFDSPSIDWEQCIIEGHPTHPMHKARRTMPPIAPLQPGEYDWHRPHIRLVAVPRTSMHIQGPWDDLLAPVRAAAAENARKSLNVPDDQVVVAVHDLQVANIREKFPEARILPEEYHVDALAQQSIRTVLVPSALRSLCLKLALGVRLTSAMRTISPPSAYLGPRFSSTVVPLLTYDRSLLVVQRELASVSHVNPESEVAKHLAGIVREAYENTSVEEKGERVIVCTALVETGYGGEDEVPLVQMAFGLDTEEKRIAWLDKFVDVYLKAFLPSVIANGVAFEAHPQNTLARFDLQTRELTGFLIRDFGGLRIHPPTLLASTGLASLDAVIAPGHSIIADTLEDVHTRLYHTLIHNHLQQLIRVLGLHYSGKGWEVVRRRLGEHIPEGHELGKLWLSPETETLPGKCFMRMRLQGMYRTHLHGPFSNLIHYRGDGGQ